MTGKREAMIQHYRQLNAAFFWGAPPMAPEGLVEYAHRCMYPDRWLVVMGVRGTLCFVWSRCVLEPIAAVGRFLLRISGYDYELEPTDVD